MNYCVIYFHGFKGSPESITKKAIEVALPDLKVVGFPINHEEDPAVTEFNLDVLFNDVLEIYNPREIIVVGNSAGSFWANHFARTYGTKLILINPSLYPRRNLTKYGLDEKVLKALENFHVSNKPLPDHFVFVGEEDDVVDNSDIGFLFQKVQILPGEGHRLRDHLPVINKVREMTKDEEIY